LNLLPAGVLKIVIVPPPWAVQFTQLLLLQHGFRYCLLVHRSFIALAAACCLLSTPVMAIPAMDDLELRLQGEAKG